MKPSGTELKREAAAWNTGGRYVGEHYPDRWQSCQGGPASGGTGGQDRLGQRTERKVTRGLRGCCSRSSQASRSTYTRHTPMPVSHPLGWEEPVSCSRENGNIQVQETSHPAWQHVFFGSEHTAPTLRQAAHSRGADAPPKRFQRGAPRQDNQTVEGSPMAEDKFTEFTSRRRVNRTKRPCLQFQVLEPSIGPEHLAKYHTKSGWWSQVTEHFTFFAPKPS